MNFTWSYENASGSLMEYWVIQELRVKPLDGMAYYEIWGYKDESFFTDGKPPVEKLFVSIPLDSEEEAVAPALAFGTTKGQEALEAYLTPPPPSEPEPE